MSRSLQPLSERLPNLPLLICGPIVRRVDERHVSIFVVLRQGCRVRLQLFGSSRREAEPLLSAERETLSLGTFFHPVLVTATFEPGTLEPGRSYGYNLEFHPQGDSSTPADLASLGLLDGPFPLGYESGALPTLVLPPERIEELRLLHGSCRKPHGMGLDGLAPLDSILCRAAAGGEERRPHQLVMSGDQIYADDVAEPMLELAMDVGETLVGRRENPPSPMQQWPEALAPGRRREVVCAPGLAAFTTDTPDNHLIRFCEYVGMYLLTWSPVLWPSEDKLRRFLGKPPGKTPRRILEADPRNDRDRLWQFHTTLPQVRRALANIPTYMIFDDHDVTDDWNLNGDWCRAVYSDPEGAPLGPRLVQNALAAYTVFQGWGNDPEAFAAGTRGGEVLEVLSRWAGEAHDDARLFRLLRVDPRLPLETGMAWHYSVRFAAHRLLVLDTRTCRRFCNEDEAGAELIAEEHLGHQLLDPLECDNPDPAVTVAVSPGPVFGVRLLEDLQRLAVSPAFRHMPFIFNPLRTASEAIDAEAWRLHEEAFQNLIRALGRGERVVLLSGDVHYAFTKRCELWVEDLGKHSVIAQLTASSFKNESVFLWLMHQWGAVLQDPCPRYYHGWDTSGGELVIRDRDEVQLGMEYRTSEPVPALLSRRLYKTRSTVVFEADSATWNPDPPSQWKYQLLISGRPVRFLPALVEVVRAYFASLPGNLRRARLTPAGLWRAIRPSQALWSTEYAGKTLIGVSCIGDISFSEDPLEVCHRLWWRNPWGEVGAFTEHTLSLCPARSWPPPEPDAAPC